MNINTLKTYNAIHEINLTDKEIDIIRNECNDRTKRGVCVPVSRKNCYIIINHDDNNNILVKDRTSMKSSIRATDAPFRILINALITCDVPSELHTIHKILDKGGSPTADFVIHGKKALRKYIANRFRNIPNCTFCAFPLGHSYSGITLSIGSMTIHLKINGKCCKINDIAEDITDVKGILEMVHNFKSHTNLEEFLKVVRKIGLLPLKVLSDGGYARTIRINKTNANTLIDGPTSLIARFSLVKSNRDIYMVLGKSEYIVKSFTDLSNVIRTMDKPMDGNKKVELLSSYLNNTVEDLELKDLKEFFTVNKD